MNRGVFLDRDGTIIADRGYLANPNGIEFLPGVTEGLRMLADNGYLLVVVSNQSGVGRGYFGREDLESINKALCSLLMEKGIELDAIYYCVHTEKDNCDCRKPLPGLAEQAADDLDLELEKCFVVGDKTSDVMLAKNLECGSVLLLTGAAGTDATYYVEPDYTARTFLEAAEFICRHSG